MFLAEFDYHGNSFKLGDAGVQVAQDVPEALQVDLYLGLQVLRQVFEFLLDRLVLLLQPVDFGRNLQVANAAVLFVRLAGAEPASSVSGLVAEDHFALISAFVEPGGQLGILAKREGVDG